MDRKRIERQWLVETNTMYIYDGATCFVWWDAYQGDYE